MFRFIIFVVLYFGLAFSTKERPNPIVLMHGYTDSMLIARRLKPTDAIYCPVRTDWFKVWFDIEGLKIYWECWASSMVLNATDEGYSLLADGVDVRNEDSSLQSVRTMDPSNFIIGALTMYMGNMIDYFQKNGNYSFPNSQNRLDQNLDAVPYDWRLSPLNHYLPGGLFERLRERIEKMHNATEKKVSLVGHSMGASYSALFLNTYVDQAWKDEHIHKFVSVAGVYAGAPKFLQGILSGDNENKLIPATNKYLQKIQSTYGSLHSMLPVNTKQKKYWQDSEVLVSIGGKSYSVDQVPEMYKALGINPILVNTVNKLRSMNFQSPPNVTTHCIYNKGHKTITSIHLDSATGEARYKPKMSYGDGDGIVPLRSLEVCKGWGKQQHNPVTSNTFFFSSHQDLITKDKMVWNDILGVVKGN